MKRKNALVEFLLETFVKMRECKEGQNFGIMRGKNSPEKKMVYFIGIIVGNKNKKNPRHSRC